MIKRFLPLILLLFILSPTAIAQEEALPAYRGYVNDFAGVLSSQGQALITQLAQQVDSKTTAQIAVVTVSTVQPLTIEQYAVSLFEKWGIGQKDKDNGVLILMAVNDKKVRIETGYGLEGAIPDAIASQVIYQVMIPEFKQGAMEKGLLMGTIAVADLIAKEYNVSLNVGEAQAGYIKRTEPTSKQRAIKALLYLIFFILMFGLRSGLLFYLILGPTGRRRGGHWYGGGFGGSGGGFGGGFGGFGGGFSGGGGASGGW